MPDIVDKTIDDDIADTGVEKIMKKYKISPEDIDKAIRGGMSKEEWERKNSVPVKY